MANEKTLTAQQRAQLFGAATRQHFQMVSKQNVTETGTIEFRVPKARILEGFRARFHGVYSADVSAKVVNGYEPYNIIRRLAVDFNNGFSPIVVSGAEMARMNTLSPYAKMIKAADKGTLCKVDGKNVDFMLDIPLALNYRDPVGLVLAQNAETTITVTFDINTAVNAFGLEGLTLTEGYIELEANSFSIPANTNYMPDMSVLKVVDARNEVFVAGPNYIKLPVGMIYRKMVFMFTDVDGNPLTDADITSNIEIVLNTADIPYSISPAMLKNFNLMQIGEDMGEGCYFFSFDWQGLAANYGGSRDLLDTERITELAVRFSTGKAGKITIISEKMSRLIAG